MPLNRKIAYVDLTTGKIEIKSIPLEVRKKFIGGRGLDAYLLYNHTEKGCDHLVIKGKGSKPVYLWIHNGEIEIRDAADIWGKTVTETQWAIRKELNDEEIKSLVIGPAGENLVRFANVMTGIKNSGGRTGMGAVMGSKNLKAIAVR